VGVLDQRVEFVVRASRKENLSSLCREYAICRPTGYLWLKRSCPSSKFRPIAKRPVFNR
jgi:hypothetical protein